MKRKINFSSDAKDLLENSELSEIKAGINTSFSSDSQICDSGCSFACVSSCTACTQCTSCTARALDVIPL